MAGTPQNLDYAPSEPRPPIWVIWVIGGIAIAVAVMIVWWAIRLATAINSA